MVEQSRRLNTSFYSYYVDDTFYEQLVMDLREWDKDFIPVEDPERFQCERVILKEARLLDELRFEEFLSLYTKTCLYWVPITPGGGDPRKEVSLAFDDRRRLEDRIYRLRTGYAYSQLPMSRTRRMITNMEFSYDKSRNEVRVRSNFIIFEYRVGQLRSFAGWYGHKLRHEEAEWKIDVKMVNLIDSDQAHENLTFML